MDERKGNSASAHDRIHAHGKASRQHEATATPMALSFRFEVVDQLAGKAYDRSIDLVRTVRSLLPMRRVLPSYLIIGAQKAGTTSLHALVAQHPEVRGSLRKEVHYFDLNYSKGEGWYRTFFPRDEGEKVITGEASPYYIFHPQCPQRIAGLVPEARLIVLLRHPVKRAVSHYHHEVRLGHETRSLERAIAEEDAMLKSEETQMAADPGYRSFAHQHHSYRARGRYVEQLDRYYRHFPKEQILILKSSELYRTPVETSQKVFSFLGVDPTFQPHKLEAKNTGKYKAETDKEVPRQLSDYYAPHNERLFELIGRDLGWR